jgi:hypothetical protein
LSLTFGKAIMTPRCDGHPTVDNRPSFVSRYSSIASTSPELMPDKEP